MKPTFASMALLAGIAGLQLPAAGAASIDLQLPEDGATLLTSLQSSLQGVLGIAAIMAWLIGSLLVVRSMLYFRRAADVGGNPGAVPAGVGAFLVAGFLLSFGGTVDLVSQSIFGHADSIPLIGYTASEEGNGKSLYIAAAVTFLMFVQVVGYVMSLAGYLEARRLAGGQRSETTPGRVVIRIIAGALCANAIYTAKFLAEVFGAKLTISL